MAQARDRQLRRQAVPLAHAFASPSAEDNVVWYCSLFLFCFEFRILFSEFRIQDLEFRIWNSEFRIERRRLLLARQR
jgi:hypothetical protein